MDLYLHLLVKAFILPMQSSLPYDWLESRLRKFVWAVIIVSVLLVSVANAKQWPCMNPEQYRV